MIDKTVSLSEAAALTPAGSTLALGGMTLYRRPLAVGNARLEANTGIISMHRHRKDVAMAPNAEKLELAFISSR